MKRQYIRWSVIAGLLLTGSYGGYQGYQYVAGGSEIPEVKSTEGSPGTSNSPKLIVVPETDVAIANGLLSSPVSLEEHQSPIVRGNNEDNEYTPLSNFDPSGSVQSVGTNNINSGNLRANEGISPALGKTANSGITENALRNAPPLVNDATSIYNPPAVPRGLENGLGAPAPLGNTNYNAAPLGDTSYNGVPLGNEPVGARQDLGFQQAPAPITSAPLDTGPYQAPVAQPTDGRQFKLAPLTTEVGDNANAANDTAIYNPNIAPLGNNGINNKGINNNQNYDTPTAPIQGFGQPNTGRPVASPNFASNGGSNIDDPRNFNAAAATPLGGAAGQGTPGARNLEGPQSPQVVLEKRAPEEIQVNVPATFEIVVRNVGAIDANEVTVVDEVPDGTQFSEASPAAQQIGGSVTWQLGTLKPGDERVLSMVVIPVREGEVGSVARVQFQAQATSRTTCTKPMLKVTQTGPQSVLAGEYVTFTITVSNPGTGAAYDVVLEEDVPAGLSHQAGSELQHSLGTLPPGSTRELQLTLKAEKAGMIANEIRVRGKGKIIARDALKLEVVAPELQLTLDGPSRRYLNREATYTFSVYNPGTAPAKDVELISYLPKGFEFKEADKQGHYDPRKHAVYWSLTQLPPDQKGLVSLTVVPVETGSHKVRAESRAQQNLSAAYEHEVEVSALAELKLTIADSADPIELGKDTVYEIRVTNTGSKEAVNVRLAVTLPVGLRPIGADGPTREQIDGQNVSFQGLTRLDTNSSTVFRVQAQGVSAGDQTIKVQVVCDDSQAPTVYEEVTRVYQD